MPAIFNRRSFLSRAACSLAASPLLTPVRLASAPWEPRLVVIVLRGGMDGLAVVQPRGAPEFTKLRPGGAEAPDLDGYFALHPALLPLMELWRQGDLGFVHAVSTPYRDKRSHFDGQDLLEAGTATLEGSRDGWLNRMLGQMPMLEPRTAFAVGRGEMKLLNGPAPVADWSPDADLTLSAQAMRLAELVMQEDPAFHAALSEAAMLSTGGGSPVKGKAHEKVAAFVADQLRGETRVASFSINGWDTHQGQERTLKPVLGRLSDTVLTLRDRLGPAIWGQTAIVMMTEFGRTVRLNGTGGTDHGTGGVMVLAGGAIRGGRVLGVWPGLAEADLYARRDLMPTGDVRAPAAWLMRGLVGLDRSTLEGTVFPGLDMGADPGLLL